MKKSILALLVLLFLLIITCVYQNTYEIYAKDNNNNTAKPSHIATPTPIHTVKQKAPVEKEVSKEEKKVILSEPKKQDTKKQDIQKQVSEKVEKKTTETKAVATTASIPTSTVKKDKDETKIVKHATPVNKSTLKPASTPANVTTSEPVSKPVSKTIEPKVTVSKTTKTITQPQSEKHKTHKTSTNYDLLEIDSLIQALKDRDIALNSRAEFELQIQQLIKKALDDRFTAIAYMNKEELRLLELQKELLNVRDIAYDKIGQTNTPKSGE